MKIYDNPQLFDRFTVVLPGVILIGSPCLKVAYQDTKERPDRLPLGKKISLSELSGDFKEKVCNHMSLPNFRLPMWRSNTAEGKCKLGKIRPVNGDYDNGGAYWGIGETLYCAKSKKSFVWANSPYEAIKEFESMGLTF